MTYRSEEDAAALHTPTYRPVQYGMSFRVSKAALEADGLMLGRRRRPSRWKRFLAWFAHRPLLLVAIAGFVCAAALVDLFAHI